jgi:hypothetical protein
MGEMTALISAACLGPGPGLPYKAWRGRDWPPRVSSKPGTPPPASNPPHPTIVSTQALPRPCPHHSQAHRHLVTHLFELTPAILPTVQRPGVRRMCRGQQRYFPPWPQAAPGLCCLSSLWSAELTAAGRAHPLPSPRRLTARQGGPLPSRQPASICQHV